MSSMFSEIGRANWSRSATDFRTFCHAIRINFSSAAGPRLSSPNSYRKTFSTNVEFNFFSGRKTNQLEIAFTDFSYTEKNIKNWLGAY